MISGGKGQVQVRSIGCILCPKSHRKLPKKIAWARCCENKAAIGRYAGALHDDFSSGHSRGILVEGAIVALSSPVVQQSLVVDWPAGNCKLQHLALRKVILSHGAAEGQRHALCTVQKRSAGFTSRYDSGFAVCHGVKAAASTVHRPWSASQYIQRPFNRCVHQHSAHQLDSVHVNLPWKVGRRVLVTFKAASIARPLTARLVPVASRRVLSPRGRLLPHSRVCRGRSWVGRVVVTGYRPPLKANDAPFGVS